MAAGKVISSMSASSTWRGAVNAANEAKGGNRSTLHQRRRGEPRNSQIVCVTRKAMRPNPNKPKKQPETVLRGDFQTFRGRALLPDDVLLEPRFRRGLSGRQRRAASTTG